MAHVINTNHTDHWELYSTIAEGSLAVFKTKNELIRYIANEKVYEGKLRAIEEMMIFPEGWAVNYQRQVPKSFAFVDWERELLNAPDDQYYKLIDEKYEELMKQLK